jgi:hypothetical protein
MTDCIMPIQHVQYRQWITAILIRGCQVVQVI